MKASIKKKLTRKASVRRTSPKKVVVPKKRLILPPSYDGKMFVPSKFIYEKHPDFSSLVDLSCVDWEQRIMEGRSLISDGLVLDKARAERARRIYGNLQLPDVSGKPSLEEVGGEWFAEIVEALFGSFNGIERFITEVFLMIPKKNSKTTNGAGVMTTVLIESDRPLAEFLLVAPTKSVAQTAFDQAVGMIRADDEGDLVDLIYIQDHIKKLTNRRTGATLQIKSFSTEVMTGTKPCGILLDELHVIAQDRNADRVIGQLRGGLISQPEGFLMTITTQSERPPQGVFNIELNKARQVRDGKLRLKLLPILYEFPESIAVSEISGQEKWRDSKYWWMVTPNRNRSITVKRLEQDYVNAVSAGEQEIRRWASQHLNVEVGMALRSDAWTGAKYWQPSALPLTLAELVDRCEVIVVGIDGGGLDDLLSFTALGREPGELILPEDDVPPEEVATINSKKRWLSWTHAWMSQVAYEIRKGNQVSYDEFIADGDLTLIDSLGQDLDELCEYTSQVQASNKLDKIGLDPAGVGLIVDELVKIPNVTVGETIVGVSQGWRLNSAIKTIERKLADGTMRHADQRLTQWAASNCKVEKRGNAIIITKQVSGSAKIDPIMSNLNAVELMSRNPKPAKKFQMFVLQ